MPVTLTGGMTLSSIGGMRITVPVPPAITNSWADPANVIISSSVPFVTQTLYNADGTTMTGNVQIDGDEASTTRWTTSANVTISSEVPFKSTSTYNVDGTTMTGNVTIDGDEASTTRWTTNANVIISAGVPFVTTSEVET